MSFLDQLKTQANAVKSHQDQQQVEHDASTLATEQACSTVMFYLEQMVKSLNVIEPDGPKLSLDGKTPWPAMKLTGFQLDARKKMLRNREVIDYIGVAWQIVPRAGRPVTGSVSANFLPDLQRLEARLAAGWVQHERHEIRHPEKNTLQLVRLDYTTQSRGNIRVTPDHENAMLAFRLANLNGFGLTNTTWPAAQLHAPVLDELAKMVCGQPSRFA
ncbi:hypothetical protein ACFPOE_23030 [Caenimonas terrae]|uniref:Uncharacterized protein n=1 Tax=Caenimonas terrae TaxID=696074 RepID=A0ABW0NIH4_9BURK